MSLLSLSQARESLWNNFSQVNYADALPNQIRAFDTALNRVVARCLRHGKPRDTERRVLLPIYDGILTLPRGLQAILAARLLSDQDAQDGTYDCAPVLNTWTSYYSFLQNGSYWNGERCMPNIIPLTQTAQTFIIPEPGFYIRCVAIESVTPLTLIGGTDTSDTEIFTPIELDITNGTTTTSQAYNTLPQIQKPQTQNPVRIYAVDTTTAVATLIALYAPSETIPAYPQFRVPDMDGFPVVLALCKIAYVPAIADTDIITPSVEEALAWGLKAIVRMDADDDALCQKYWAYCEQELDKDRQELDGDAQIPVLRTVGAQMSDYFPNPC